MSEWTKGVRPTNNLVGTYTTPEGDVRVDERMLRVMVMAYQCPGETVGQAMGRLFNHMPPPNKRPSGGSAAHHADAMTSILASDPRRPRDPGDVASTPLGGQMSDTRRLDRIVFVQVAQGVALALILVAVILLEIKVA